MLDVCDITILSVITFPGNFGFRMLKPTRLLKSSSSENFRASINCIIEVAEKDLEIEAILKISLLERSVLCSMFFNPKELV